MKKITFLLLGIIIPMFVHAQITGQVTDAYTHKPVSGATVEISGATVITDQNGVFSIEPDHATELTVSAHNYKTQKTVITTGKMTISLYPVLNDLNEVEITTTSNTNKGILYQPMSVAKLNEKELQRGNALYLDDAVNTNIPGVFMERRTVSAGQQFNIRGYGNGERGTNGINSNFDGQGYKVYLNNIPITDAEGITLMDDIDFNSLGSVEIVKGPAGTLYGQAIAGAVNLRTKQPEANKTTVGQDVMIGSYGLQRYTTHLEIATQRSSLLINYGKQLFDGFMPHTSSHKDFVNIFGEFRPNPKQTINYYVGYSNSYDQRNGELTIGQYDTLDYSGNPAYIANDAHSNVISYRAAIGHTYRFNSHISNTTSVFGTGISSNSSSAGGWTDKTPVNYGVRSALDTRFSLGKKLHLSGITGIEAQQQNAQTIGYSMVKDSFNLTGYNIIGAMRSNQYTVTKTYNVFTEWTLALPYEIYFTAGIGFSKLSIELNDRLYSATNNNPSNPSATHKPTQYSATYTDMWAPHIAVNKVFNKTISVYASYSSGYKAPVSSYFFIPTTGQVNTGLKPEHGTQFEVGSKGELLKGRLAYQLALFDAQFADKMTVVAVPNVSNTATSYTYVVNGGSQDNKGLEALVSYAVVTSGNSFLTSLTPFANIAWSDFTYKDYKFQQLSSDKKSAVETDYSNKQVAGVPKLTANLGVDITTKPGLYGNITYNYRDGMYFTSDNGNKAGSYQLLNAKIGYKTSFLKHFSTDIYAGANNITGTQYYYMVFLNQLPDAYLPAPHEINFYGGINLKYTF